MLMDVSSADNQAKPNRFILNAGPAGETGENSAQFNQGEILKGVVGEINPDGTISMIINGKLVEAASEVNVRPGQNLYLLVDGFKNGLTYLKVISEQGTATLDENTLSVNLRGIGVPSNADTILIANKLLQHDLPVNPQNVAIIFKAVNMIGGLTTRNLDMAAFILENNIPLDKNILPFIDQFISSDGDLSRLVRELFQVLARMEAIVNSNSSSPDAPTVVITRGSYNPANAAMLNPNGTGPAPASPITASAGVTQSATAISIASVPETATPATSAGGVSDSGNIPLAIFRTAAEPASPTGSTESNPGGTAMSNATVSETATTVGGAGSANIPFVVSSTVTEPVSHTGAIGSDPGAAAPSGVAVPEAAMATTSGKTDSANIPLTDSNTPATTAGEVVPTATTVSSTVSGNADTFASITNNPAPVIHATYQPPVKLNPSAPDIAATREEKPMDLTEFVKTLRAVLDSATGKITGSGHDVNPVLQGMVKDRTLLLNNLRLLFEMVSADAMLNKTPAGQELLARISALQQQITGQALFNSAVKLGQDVFNNHFYFSFPVIIDNQLSYCQLRIQKNTGSRLDRQDNIKLVVSLDTPALGIVMFHIDWRRQGYIQLQGVMETPEVVAFIERNMDELILKLGELGYKVNNLGIKAAKTPGELTIKPQPKETKQDKITPFSIDVIA